MTSSSTYHEEDVSRGEQLARAAAGADVEFKRHWERVGAGRAVPPGGEFPFLDDAYGEAMELQQSTEAEFDRWMESRRRPGMLSESELDRIISARWPKS